MSLATPSYRAARPDDASALAAVNVQAWREAYGDGLMPAGIIATLSVEKSTEKWAKGLSNPEGPGGVIVAGLKGRIVGYVWHGPQRTPSLSDAFPHEIFALYVLAAAQRRGIATDLLSRVAQGPGTRAKRGTALWTLRDNRAARAFYESSGGRVVAEREDRRDTHILHEIAYGWTDLATLHDGKGG